MPEKKAASGSQMGAVILRRGDEQARDVAETSALLSPISERLISILKEWLGDVDSNHDKQSQSLLSYR